MNRKRTLIAVGVVGLAAILFYFYGGHRVPVGQPELVYLTPDTIPDMKAAFNSAQRDIRVLLLLSPT